MTTNHAATSSANGTNPLLLNDQGQTFLIGDTIYLRALELEDAKRPSAWRNSLFPIGSERAEEVLKGEVEQARQQGKWPLIACRRSDGAPVGALRLRQEFGSTSADLELYADPAIPGHEAVKAEMLQLVVPWGLTERELMAIFVTFDDGELALRTTAEAIGMRHAAQWRERVWRDGRWRDLLAYEALHPKWLERLGDPGPGILHAVAPDDPGRWRPREHPTFGTSTGDPPKNAVMVGPRVYLRPEEADDAITRAIAARREPETFFDNGRWPTSSIAQRQFIRRLQSTDPPTWIRFAICLRENDECIGSNGIDNVDWINRTAETETFFHNPAYRGQGYGSEAKHLLLAYAFERLGLHSVYSWVYGPNVRSAAALRKQGYRDCGRANWVDRKDGDFTFFGCFDFLATEWREMTARVAAVPSAE